MPRKLDKCVKEVKRKIKKREIKKTYKTKSGKRKKTNPWAICKASLKKS